MSERAKNELPGRLFIVEGIDGSGKSTQLDLLHKWLQAQGYLVVFSEWNSSPIVKRTTKRGKKEKLLTPISFSLIHAADFAHRIHSHILPALEAGAIVLADRYVYTAFARDAVRGVSRSWLRRLYSFVVEPTVAFYFDVPLHEAVHRIAAGRPTLKFYEAGLDLGLSDDPFESFRMFQGRIRGEYERLCEEFGLTRIDATQNIVRQQMQVREMVQPHLDGVMRLDRVKMREALGRAGLSGRYLDPRRVSEE
ncbi:MAG: thymidylate kinase [Candidatus Eisenbacteria bacterium]|nr:thymidylate kinase [Candidatus Latescibacterota bacterium]MBD3302137.1 thymidylate kinase [Candidatus Eisenbacteria bacterium]